MHPARQGQGSSAAATRGRRAQTRQRWSSSTAPTFPPRSSSARTACTAGRAPARPPCSGLRAMAGRARVQAGPWPGASRPPPRRAGGPGAEHPRGRVCRLLRLQASPPARRAAVLGGKYGCRWRDAVASRATRMPVIATFAARVLTRESSPRLRISPWGLTGSAACALDRAAGAQGRGHVRGGPARGRRRPAHLPLRVRRDRGPRRHLPRVGEPDLLLLRVPGCGGAPCPPGTRSRAARSMQ